MDRGFNERWARHPKPQATTAGVLWQKTGWQPSDMAGQRVLDAGCGCGRFSEVAASAGASVVGLDSSDNAIHAAQSLVPTGIFARHNLLRPLPRQRELIDKAFSMGVLHHTADPALAFRNVAAAVRPGGELAVWVYAQPVEDDLLPAHDLLREIASACPPKALYAACERHAVALRDLYARRPDLAYLATILRASVSPDAEECVSDTFDWHCPQHRFYHTELEVRGWFESAGFDVVWTGDFPVSMRGRKR